MTRRPRITEPALQLTGIVAAMVLVAIANVLGARHFTRWDWTTDHRWSLSPATLETLRALDAPVDLWAIAGPGDPVEESLRQILLEYQAHASHLDVHWIDPDRDAAQLMDLQSRFGLQAGQAEDGRVATDAVVILASGDKHWFLTSQELVSQSDDVHVKPREERAITQAIRSVLGGTKAKLCFTAGHGELSLDPGHDERDGLGGVKDLFEKNNYELASVDASGPDAHDPFAGCTVVVVAGPHAAFGAEEANRLRSWLLEDGSLFAAVGPMESTGSEPAGSGAGLDVVLAPFGIALDDDLVHDLTPSMAIPDTHGEGFFVEARPHGVTAALAGSADAHPPKAAVFFTRSLRHVSPAGAAPAVDLLVTSEGAYAKRSIAGATRWKDAPPREAGDPEGPFVVAMASERPAVTPGAPHGPRVVVAGSRFLLAEDNWQQPRPLHGAAFFVDSALSWLSARPEVVDVPDRPEVAAGMRVSEKGRADVERYVLLLMPLAAALLGATIWAWRRSAENKPYERPPGAGAQGGSGEPSG